MPNRLWIALLMAGTLGAQQTVAPTNEPVGEPRGENSGGYNVTQSFEAGYRWRLTGGNLGMYRSVVNFGNGIRLLGSSLSVHSREGQGGWFDEFLINTSGLGNDPYQSAMLRIQKNRFFRYDMAWRLNEYYNPGLVTASGSHFADTSRRLQDHDVILLPQSRIQLRAGYSRNTENGPGLWTAQEFDPGGPGFPIFRDVWREWNEYRLGTSLDLAGWKFTLIHRWAFFKDDTPYTSAGAFSAGGGDPTLLQNFRRAEPVHGSNPGWLGNLTTQRKRWSANARLTYVSGRRNFLVDELASGVDRLGGAATRQILVGGNARRPMEAVDLDLSFFPTGSFTINNNTSYTSNRIDGDSVVSELISGANLGPTIYFRYLGIRTFVNSTDVSLRVTPRIGFYGGYRYSDRRIRTVESLDGTIREEFVVKNRLHSGRAGVRFKPWRPVTLNVEGEIGRANRPLTPISQRNYHAINGRAEYRARRLQLSTVYRQIYNVNSPLSFSAHSSHSRNYSANASWSFRDGFALDASYTKLHLDTVSSLAFFASASVRPQLQTGYSSLYLSNTHAGTLGAHFSIRRRVDLFAGYSVTLDRGDGRAAATPGGAVDPIAAFVASVQTFPLRYQTPLGRVSIRITPKLRWNAGWQFYSYAEDFHLFGVSQNFRAHTGYTSLLWAF